MPRPIASSSGVQKCPGCNASPGDSSLGEPPRVCAVCGYHTQLSARERIALLVDQGSFRELDPDLVSVDPLNFMDSKSYRERLRETRKETGMREAVVTGLCLMAGAPAVLVVLDFRFLGGTMGSVVGEKIASAFEEATKRRIPLVSVAASGGARVQEGMLSLMQMAKVAACVARHDRQGLPFISVLTNPTFGGVTASFASLGDVILAEPGAQIGFVGPRVIEQTTGIAPPADSHSAETLVRNGLIDRVVPRKELRAVIVYLLTHLKSKKAKRGAAERLPRVSRKDRLPAWQHVGLARHAGRPTSRYYISQISANFLELHGDRWGGDDPAIIGGLAEIDQQTVMIVAQERGGSASEKQSCHGGSSFPEGYRKASRLMRLAAKFGVPVVTFIDTPGAQATFDSEARGIAHAIANSLAVMAGLKTPIVAVNIGEGGSGGALALGVADRVLMLEHSIYSVISPEGAASILYRDVTQAEDVSERLKLTGRDLLRLGVIDKLVPEPKGGAHLDPTAAAATVKLHLNVALQEIRRIPTQVLLNKRYEKFRNIGKGGVYWQEEIRMLLGDFVRGLFSSSGRRKRAAPAATA